MEDHVCTHLATLPSEQANRIPPIHRKPWEALREAEVSS